VSDYVYLLVYRNRQGEDVFVYRNEDARFRGACQIIVDWWDEIKSRDARDTIREHLNKEEWAEAVGVWQDYQEEDPSSLGEELNFYDESCVEDYVVVPAPPAEEEENVEEHNEEGQD
jgi:hypothetical protein